MPYFKVPVMVYLEAADIEEAQDRVWEAVKTTDGFLISVGNQQPREITEEGWENLRRLKGIINNAAKEPKIEHPLFPDQPGKTKIRFSHSAVKQYDYLLGLDED